MLHSASARSATGTDLSKSPAPTAYMKLVPLLLAGGRHFRRIALLILSTVPLAAAPFISEFQASNRATIKDEDGQASDWIEITNPDPVPAAMGGYALTDNPATPQKWIFPPVEIPARGAILVWASGKNRTVPALHADFLLEAEGGYLALTSPDGVTTLTEFTYPAQPVDRSYGRGFPPPVTSILLTQGAPCRWLVPTATVPGWPDPAFNDTAWTPATMGIGYDRQAAIGVNFLPLIGTKGNVEGSMFNIRGTVYIRVPFSMASARDTTRVTLRMKYDDGFAAFLNGSRILATAATGAPVALNFNSLASASRPDSISFSSFDVSSQKHLIVDGNNVLGIQGLNAQISSSDLLMLPELEVVTQDTSQILTGYIERPTPGALNTATPVQGFLDAPDYSVKRGFYTTAQTVTLTTNSPESTIRYTLDGSPPAAATGALYTEPLTISNTSVLRAGTFRAGYAPSRIKSHTYLFAAQIRNQPAAPAGFPATWGHDYNYSTGTTTGALVQADYRMDPAIANSTEYAPLLEPALTSTLPVLSVSTTPGPMFDPSGIYADGRVDDPATELTASFEFFGPGITDGWQEDAGLRIHGGNSPIDHPKKPFRIYFRKDYGTGKLRYPLFPGGPVESFDALQLRPGGHDGWAVPFGSGTNSLARHATYLRDRFLRGTELDMGRQSPRGRFVHLYINGLYWGHYDLHEVPAATYFADYLGGKEEDWDVVQNPRFSNESFGLIDGSSDAMNQLLTLCRPPENLASAAVYAEALTYLDTEAFADHLIVQMWAGQNDWMGPVFKGVGNTDASRFFNKNWDSGRMSRGTSGAPFHWNVWDAEISMGSHLTSLVSTMQNVDFDLTRIGTPVQIIPRVAGTPGPPAEIYNALRQNPTFRRTLADRLQHHFFNDGAMTLPRNQARLNALATQLELPIVAESARWGDVNSGDPEVITFTRSHWLEEVDWMRSAYLPLRNKILLGQFASIGIWPATLTPQFSLAGGFVTTGTPLSITDLNSPSGIIYYTLDGSDPFVPQRTVEMPLVTAATPAIWKIPLASYPGNAWKRLAPPSDIATWHSGTASLGFDTTGVFSGHFATALPDLRGTGSSVYSRISFELTEAQRASLSGLALRLKYDDGAFVFLNGSVPLVRLNAPATTPEWYDTAVDPRADELGTSAQYIDISAALGTLITGTNVLALQGLSTGLTDNNLLLAPVLSGISTIPASISPAAKIYSGPFPLLAPGTVKARVLRNGEWSPLNAATFIAGIPAKAGNLTISEFNYNPGPVSAAEAAAGYTAQDFEFIELLNISTQTIETAGLKFLHGIEFAFPPESPAPLAPAQRLVLAAHPAALRFRHPALLIAGTFTNGSALSNGGERLTLADDSGSLIFDFSFNDKLPWPASADGLGPTLVLINPEADPDVRLSQNWRTSGTDHGHPGEADPDSYAAWAARSRIAGPAQEDADLNGLTNLMEYALGIPPAAASAALDARIENLAGSSYLLVSYRSAAAAPGTSITPEMSFDLHHWSPLTESAGAPVFSPGGTVTRSVRSPALSASNSRIFVRLSLN